MTDTKSDAFVLECLDVVLNRAAWQPLNGHQYKSNPRICGCLGHQNTQYVTVNTSESKYNLCAAHITAYYAYRTMKLQEEANKIQAITAQAITDLTTAIKSLMDSKTSVTSSPADEKA